MTAFLGKSCSFGLLCISFINVYQIPFGFEGEMCDLIVLIPDRYLSIRFLCLEAKNAFLSLQTRSGKRSLEKLIKFCFD